MVTRPFPRIHFLGSEYVRAVDIQTKQKKLDKWLKTTCFLNLSATVIMAFENLQMLFSYNWYDKKVNFTKPIQSHSYDDNQEHSF